LRRHSTRTEQQVMPITLWLKLFFRNVSADLPKISK
jgi:hypothetical protein